MKINSVKSYGVGTSALKNQAPNFKGIKPDDVIDYGKEIAKHSKPFANLLSKLKDGEVMNILTTAFGTAVVAPIFIAFNPLSKKDKETKMYSALRQPISAVIAVAAQLGVANSFNHWAEKLASTGVIDNMDLKYKPQESYLKKLIKHQNPTLSNKEVMAKVKEMQLAAEKEGVAAYTKILEGTKTEDILTADLISVKDITNKKTQLLKAHEADLKAGKTNISIKDFKKSLKEIVEVNGKKMTKLEQLTLEGIKDGVETAAKKAGGNLDEALRNETIAQYAKQMTAKAGDLLGSFKKYGGIVLTLATLPITCGILNWAYPRIVEKFFPNLAKSKCKDKTPPPEMKQPEPKKAEV